MLLVYRSMRNNLVHLGGHSTHRDVADMSTLFCFYSALIWSRGMIRLPRSHLSKQMGWTKIDINNSGSMSRRKLCKCVFTNLN